MIGRETRDPAWRQQERPDQNDNDPAEYCRRCFAPIDDAGDGWCGLCPDCADADEAEDGPEDEQLMADYDDRQNGGLDVDQEPF